MIKSVVFDLDETLIDGKRMHHDAMIESLNKFGFMRKKITWIRGARTEEILKHNLPDLEIGLIKKITEHKRKIVKNYMHFAKPLPGLKELLCFIRQNSLVAGMVTNNSRKELLHFLKYLGIDKYFDLTVCTEDGAPKPSPKMLNVFMKKTKLKPFEIIYVGDSNYDILMCKKAKMRIILNTKVHKASMRKKADFVAKNLKQVKNIIQKEILKK